MSLSLEERSTFRSSVDGLLSARASIAEGRHLASTEHGFDDGLWRAMAELGWTALLLPVELGGVGTGMAEVRVVLESLGERLVPGPFMSSAVLATGALVDAEASADVTSWLDRLGDGSAIATLALPLIPTLGDSCLWPEARLAPGGWALSGSVPEVLHADVADLIIVFARGAGDEDDLVFALDRKAIPHHMDSFPLVDQTRRMQTVRFAESFVPEQMTLARGAAARELLRRADLRAAFACAADSLGGARAVHAMAVAYAQERVQFGRPIGSFQAIKHKLASMYVDLVSSDDAVYEAAEQDDLDSPGAIRLLRSAAYHALEAYPRIAGDAIQVHGGIGFTWEHDAHRYFKRAWVNRALFAGSERLRDAVAAELFSAPVGA